MKTEKIALLAQSCYRIFKFERKYALLLARLIQPSSYWSCRDACSSSASLDMDETEVLSTLYLRTARHRGSSVKHKRKLAKYGATHSL